MPHPDTLDRFETLLAAHDSATEALVAWCRAEGIAADPQIRAVLVRGEERPASAETWARLGVPPSTPLAYRHVRLLCGDKVLSDAHNWYLPDALTPGMRHALETTDTPFGKAVAALNFKRTRLASERGQGADCPDGTVLAQHARLNLPDGRPLALLTECYTGEILPVE
ncbi:MAG: hypothetical protein M0R03_02875 [Novosphingobium sp.]|nr:hypothetical protein [Novosphingobium sp.]